MPQDYNSDPDVSTDVLPAPNQRRIIVYAALAVVGIGGIALLFALALGLANPPRAGSLSYQTSSPADWDRFPDLAQSRLFSAPNRLPAPPFTIEMTASNQGSADSAWGFWSLTPDGSLLILISQDGYFSTSTDGSPHWAQFIHIQPGANKLSINVTEDRKGTLRINDEIAWTGDWTGINRWGAAEYHSPNLTWQGIRVYNG